MTFDATATQQFGNAASLLQEAIAAQKIERDAWNAALYEVADAVLWVRIVGGEAVIYRVNMAAERLLGPGILVPDREPRPLIDIIPDKWRAQHLEGVSGDLQAERPVSYCGRWHHDFEALTMDRRQLSISLLVLKLRNGEDRQYLGIIRERKDG